MGQMRERLTDEQLREWRDRRDPSGQPIHPQNRMFR